MKHVSIFILLIISNTCFGQDSTVVLELDPASFEKNYALGADAFNIAADLYREMVFSDNMEGENLEKYNAALVEAQLFMEKAHKAKPEHLKTINTLFSIYSRLELKEEYAILKSEYELIKARN